MFSTGKISDLPIVTVITSTLNCREDLFYTVQSIRGQTFIKNIQWIIIDGGSCDGTIDLIKENLDIIDYWISEPDKGIYDAWNKALKHIKGEWVQFIGAGDEYYDNCVVENILPVLATAFPSHALVYGKLQYLSPRTREARDVVGVPWIEMKGKWEFFRPKLPIHPEIFHHFSLFLDNNFDTSYKIAGDSHFLLRIIFSSRPLFVPMIIDRMPLGGASGSIRKAYPASLELKRIARELGYRIPIPHFLVETLKLLSKRFLCAALSDRYLYKIANLYRYLAGKSCRW